MRRRVSAAVDFATVFRASAAHFTDLAAEYAANGRHEDAYFAKLNARYAKQLADSCDHPIQRVKRSRDRGPSLF